MDVVKWIRRRLSRGSLSQIRRRSEWPESLASPPTRPPPSPPRGSLPPLRARSTSLRRLDNILKFPRQFQRSKSASRESRLGVALPPIPAMTRLGTCDRRRSLIQEKVPDSTVFREENVYEEISDFCGETPIISKLEEVTGKVIPSVQKEEPMWNRDPSVELVSDGTGGRMSKKGEDSELSIDSEGGKVDEDSYLMPCPSAPRKLKKLFHAERSPSPESSSLYVENSSDSPTQYPNVSSSRSIIQHPDSSGWCEAYKSQSHERSFSKISPEPMSRIRFLRRYNATTNRSALRPDGISPDSNQQPSRAVPSSQPLGHSVSGVKSSKQDQSCKNSRALDIPANKSTLVSSDCFLIGCPSRGRRSLGDARYHTGNKVAATRGRSSLDGKVLALALDSISERNLAHATDFFGGSADSGYLDDAASGGEKARLYENFSAVTMTSFDDVTRIEGDANSDEDDVSFGSSEFYNKTFAHVRVAASDDAIDDTISLTSVSSLSNVDTTFATIHKSLARSSSPETSTSTTPEPRSNNSTSLWPQSPSSGISESRVFRRSESLLSTIYTYGISESQNCPLSESSLWAISPSGIPKSRKFRRSESSVSATSFSLRMPLSSTHLATTPDSQSSISHTSASPTSTSQNSSSKTTTFKTSESRKPTFKTSASRNPTLKTSASNTPSSRTLVSTAPVRTPGWRWHDDGSSLDPLTMSPSEWRGLEDSQLSGESSDDVMSISMMAATIKVLQKQMEAKKRRLKEKNRRRSCPVAVSKK